MKTLMIYGATGYTGKMIAHQAKKAGLNFVVAGRDKQKLGELAETLGVSAAVFTLEDPKLVREQLVDIAVVLNCAGPFAKTAEPLIKACIENGIDYLDITAEINVYRLAESLQQSATQAGSMLMPGVGWDVVPTDSLAVTLSRQVKNPQRLRIALQVAGSMSRGSAISAGEIFSAGLLARVNGELTTKQDASMGMFDFGLGAVECAPLSFGDLVTAWHSTSIPNIEMFVHVAGAGFPEGDLSLLPDGPSLDELQSTPARAVVEITGADGEVHRAIIDTVNGYAYTPLAAIEAAKRALEGQRAPGFQTPAKVFGDDFALSIPGTRITVLNGQGNH
ncbi:saccharopine dehydrogenase NADP-binding domain-containing protein [Rouxiella sp. T17]|uniref:saccharopine dehydrogenase family protein n=1 Tax=Rouxiella sp. T17 TaxID=3085684 RepID=UPI002FCA2B8C